MGLLGCPASFQRLMEKVMEGIQACIVYIDNLLVHTNTHEKHLINLEQVISRLEANGLKINLDKCFLATKKLVTMASPSLQKALPQAKTNWPAPNELLCQHPSKWYVLS